MTPTTTQQIHHASIEKFSPSCIKAVAELQAVANEATRKADAQEAAFAAKISTVRGLIEQVLTLRFRARRALDLAELDADAQAEHILDNFTADAALPDLWKIPLHYGAAVLAMAPALRKAGAKAEKQADALEAKLKLALADGEVNVRALCEDMRLRCGARIPELDALAERLAKP